MATAYPGICDSGGESDSGQIDQDAKILALTQEAFTKPHVDESVCAINYNKTLITKNSFWQRTCWRSTNDNKILLGGHSHITVFHDNGEEDIYRLPMVGIVTSGVSITDEKQMVCIYGRSVITVNITPDTPDGSKLHAVNTLVVSNPIHMFPITKVKYGILAWYKHSGLYKQHSARIEFFTLKSILLDQNPSLSGFIKVDTPNPDGKDTACALSDDIICVASYMQSVIYQYDIEGRQLAVIGSKRGLGERLGRIFIRPGRLLMPISIQRCGDMLLVAGCGGDIHAYQDGGWKLLTTSWNTGLRDYILPRKCISCVFSGTKLWAIEENDNWYLLTNVHVYDVANA